MASFQYKDICYPSPDLALEAFVKTSFPQMVGTNSPVPWVIDTGITTVNSLGLITFRYKNGYSTPNTVYTGNFYYQLHSCSEISTSTVFDKMPVQDMIFAAAFVLVFVIGIFQGHKS